MKSEKFLLEALFLIISEKKRTFARFFTLYKEKE